MTARNRKVEDTAEGCRSLAENDRGRATTTTTPRMRVALGRSADAWTARAALLDRLETIFNERVAENRGLITRVL